MLKAEHVDVPVILHHEIVTFCCIATGRFFRVGSNTSSA